jgi:hypothetical protein
MTEPVEIDFQLNRLWKLFSTGGSSNHQWKDSFSLVPSTGGSEKMTVQIS